MIRFIDIGDQITEGERHFAFWDTVRDRFLEFGDEQTFASAEDFEEAARQNAADVYLVARCLGLIRPAELVHRVGQKYGAECLARGGLMTIHSALVTCPRCNDPEWLSHLDDADHVVRTCPKCADAT